MTVQTTDIRPGDLVRVKPEYAHSGIFGIWVADKFLTKNWELKRPADYRGMNAHKKLRAKPYQLERVTAENAAISPNALPPLNDVVKTAQVSTYSLIDEGMLVEINDPSGKIKRGVYVVTRGNITGNPSRVNVTELGGGTKWRVPVQFVTVIPKGQFTITYGTN